jgi:hypothetical protein
MSIENDETLPEGWSKQFSNTYKRDYWYNDKDKKTSWTKPTCISSSSKKRHLDDMQNTNEAENLNNKKSNSISPPSILRSPEIAIIVPFRDIHAEQKRKQHLDRFVPEITSFLKKSNKEFRIYIIEQSNDGRKFNRGKLLNIGFDLAKKDGCDTIILHDVDLIPSFELLDYYINKPKLNQPVHIARVWERYNKNSKYFGGIVAFSREQYQKINGYPNNFWGWGGEDDELYKRSMKVILFD